MPRQTGSYGRRPPKRQPAIQFHRLLTPAPWLPQHPAAIDYLERLGGGWQMLGNEAASDCVAVTWANMRRLITTGLTATPSYPTQDQVWAFYKTQNPDFDPAGDPSVNGPGSQADGGMDIQTALEYLVKVGGPDGVKAVGFAQVAHSIRPEVKAALAYMGCLWTGSIVLQVNEDQFAADQPWGYDASSAQAGGHSTLTGGYGPWDEVGADERFITWAQETAFTDDYWSHEMEECWAVIWPEHLGSKEFMDNINLTQFEADYVRITGRPFPQPTGTGSVQLVTGDRVSQDRPSGRYGAADLELARHLHGWVDETHVGHNGRVAAAGKAWLQARGLEADDIPF